MVIAVTLSVAGNVDEAEEVVVVEGTVTLLGTSSVTSPTDSLHILKLKQLSGQHL
jgi:hypothetical protein